MPLSKAQCTDVVKPLKGSPLSIFVTLVLFGGSLTGKELQIITGYSDEAVTTATTYLEMREAIQNNGKNNGWSIRGREQLPLPFQQLAGAVMQLSTGFAQGGNHDPVLPDHHSQKSTKKRVDPVLPDQLPPPPPPYIHRQEGEEGHGEDSETAKTYALCRSRGVGEKMAQKIAQTRTLEYVTAMLDQYRARKKPLRYALKAIKDYDGLEEPATNPVPTCSTCNEIIPKTFKDCPYCSGVLIK